MWIIKYYWIRFSRDIENYQGLGWRYLPQPAASADNANLCLDNYRYHAQPHPININYLQDYHTCYLQYYHTCYLQDYHTCYLQDYHTCYLQDNQTCYLRPGTIKLVICENITLVICGTTTLVIWETIRLVNGWGICLRIFVLPPAIRDSLVKIALNWCKLAINKCIDPFPLQIKNA